MISRWCFCIFIVLVTACVQPVEGYCSEIKLTSEESSWLAEHRDTLILAPTPNYPPIDFFDKNNKHSGVSGDVSRLIEKRLNIRFLRKKLPSWDNIMAEGKAGNIDLTTIAHRTDKRDEFWLFTNSYIKAPTVILTRVEMEQELSLKNMGDLKVGMVRGYAIDEYLDSNYPNLNIVDVTDDLAGLTMLSMGELDAMVADLPTAGYLISQHGIGNLRVAGLTGYIYNYSIAVRKDLPILRDILNKALVNISEQELEKTARKWFTIKIKPFYEENEFWLTTALIFLVLSAVIVVVVIVNHGLKREVSKRTHELTLAHRRLRRIFESATQVCVIATDSQGIITRFNPGAQRILGYRAEEMIGKKNITVLHLLTELESRGEEVSRQLGRRVRGFEVLVALPTDDGKCGNREWSYIRKDGHKIPVNLGLSVIKDHNNQIDGYLAIAVDISDRIKAEEALLESESNLHQIEKINAIGQLAGGIAHDFNNQLAGIMGFADLLYENIDDPKLKNFALQVISSAERASHLTQQLLAFSRKGKFLSVPTDIHKIIDEVARILSRSIDKTIEIKFQLDADSSMVVGDPAQLQNTFLNLALNARDAMPEGGELIFSSRVRDFPTELPLEEISQGRYLCVSVSDSGIGMDAETKRRLFEPFFTTKKVGKGTGLGLSSVYGAVKNHGGTLRVYSELGHGSSFNIYLPLAGENSDSVTDSLVEKVVMGNAERVMLVDDEPAVAAFAREMLEELGYIPIVFEESAKALDYYQHHWRKVDLVVLDMVMPGLNGKELFIAMKRINPKIKAILASGFSVNGAAQDILDLGVLCFIQKPFSRREIACNLDKALRNV